jgi:hypothetical protein
LITAFPKTHIVAVSLGLLLTVALILSPSKKVEANRTPLSPVISNTDSATVSHDLDINIEPPAADTSDNFSRISPTKDNWNTLTISRGDTLSTLFQKAGFNDTVMYQVLGKKQQNKALAEIFPGEKISFLTDSNDHSLSKVRLERNPIESLIVSHDQNGQYVSQTVTRTPEVEVAFAEATIENSLFEAGDKAGISHSMIMNLATIFGWDIDFALDIRPGDKFRLTYEQLFLDGKKIGDGKILSASFTNRNKVYTAVLYKRPNGISNYFTPEG